MKKVLILISFLFVVTCGLNAQTFNFSKNWNLSGVKNGEITMNRFSNDNISTIWKWSDSSWKVWSPSSSVMTLVKSYGISSIYSIYQGEGFWVNAKSSFEIKSLPMCETDFLPVATVSSDYKTGGYAIYDLSNDTAYSTLNSYPIGGDDRVYFYNGYIFVVDAPNTGNISTWYVYKIDNNASSLNQSDATTPVANYNINRQNPQSVAFASTNKAYLTTYYDNSILIFNPLTGDEIGTIDLTPYLYTSDNGTQNSYIGAEHMLIYKDKLIVTLDRARTYYGDLQPDKSMVLFINLNDDSVEKAVKVDYSPRSPQVYGNYLYFVSMGDYSAPIGKIYRINLSDYNPDANFEISSPENSDNSTDYIKNFVITPQGALYFVANSGWGKPYNVYRILNIDLYNDTAKTGFESTPVYSSDGYIPDIDFLCNYVVVADRGSSQALVLISGSGTVKKITASQLGYPPYKIGTDYNY